MTFKLKTNSLTSRTDDYRINSLADMSYIRFVFDTVTGKDLFVRVYNMHEALDYYIDIIRALEGLLLYKVTNVQEVPIDLNGRIEDVSSPDNRWPTWVNPWSIFKDNKSAAEYHFIALKIRAFKIYF